MPRASKSPAVAPAALAPSPKNLFVGTSGWAYPTWKPGFYPVEVPVRAFLQFYSSRFSTVEVNHTFRKIPDRETIRAWLDATPPGFRFSFKAPEQITHRQRLRECHDRVRLFIDALQPAQEAGKLGPILFQLPPNFKADAERLKDFLNAPAFRNESHRVLVAFEFRHQSWFTDETYALLRERSAALCVADTEEFVTPDIVTAPFLYYRFRKSGGYSARQLSNRAKLLLRAAETSEVFAYLKHEELPTGALNALLLLRSAAKAERTRGTAE